MDLSQIEVNNKTGKLGEEIDIHDYEPMGSESSENSNTQTGTPDNQTETP